MPSLWTFVVQPPAAKKHIMIRIDHDHTYAKKKSLEGNETGDARSSPSSGSKVTSLDEAMPKNKRSEVDLLSLPAEILDHLVLFLDTDTSLALMFTCKTLHDKMVSSEWFWMQMCGKERFNREVLVREYDVKDEEDVQDEDVDEGGEEDEEESDYSDENDEDEDVVVQSQTSSVARMSDLHDDDLSSDLTVVASRRAFLRGIQIRRNLRAGRFKSIRIDFPEEIKSLPKDDDFDCVPFWNDDLLVVVKDSLVSNFCSLFAWKWDRFRNPTFLYSRQDLKEELFPYLDLDFPFSSDVFLHGKYLVLAPRRGPDLIRIHDLSDSSLTTVGSFVRRDGICEHLRRVGEEDKAMLFYHSNAKGQPYKLFVVSLPSCELLVDVEVPASVGMSVTCWCAAWANKMAFGFVRSGSSEDEDDNEEEILTSGVKMLFVDFEEFVKGRGPVTMVMQQEFADADDYVHDRDILCGNRIVCLHASGKVTVREVREDSFDVVLVIPSFGECKNTCESRVTSSQGGDMFAVTTHFPRCGLKLFVYSARSGNLMYSHRLDQRRFGLDKVWQTVSVSLGRDFLVVSKGRKVVCWHAESGEFVRSFSLRESTIEYDAPTAFEFAGHGLVLFPNHFDRNPKRRKRVVADIMLFI